MRIGFETPRGTKRKASGEHVGLEPPRRIKALEQEVVNKIAAGEIIVAPVHALKELVENAVDAGSTSIEITVKDGGLKFLQITDNGHGIDVRVNPSLTTAYTRSIPSGLTHAKQQEDLPILCERFTTSKLESFEDLTSIGTYGFRGEALASISHIAHLTITTKTKESSCAWRAHYSGGKLTPAKPGYNADPKATAGRQGTQITASLLDAVVEDLFYNVPTRRRAFRSPSEEYAKILDIVGRYAVHCSGVAFSCKKFGDSSTGISITSNSITTDRIRQVHGSVVANELIGFDVVGSFWGFTARGWISNANYHVKRTMLLLFINHRAVESSAIKKAVEQTYSAFLPKGGHPFVYISLNVDPQRVDVNVHPTKRAVNFLNEDEIIEMLCDELRVKLAKCDTSRTFMTQTLLPGERIHATGVTDVAKTSTTNGIEKLSAQKPLENILVRTDAKVRKITSMFPSAQASPFSAGPTGELKGRTLEDTSYQSSDREPTLCRLTTVKELRASVRENMHHELTEVFAGHTFVGIVNERRRIAAIQGGVKLYLVDYGMISNEYFYQVGLTDFGNFGSIRFESPLDLYDLLSIAAAHEKGSALENAGSGIDNSGPAMDWENVVLTVKQQLVDRREMLREYFSLEISAAGDLVGIPLLLKGYMPSLAKLPRFLLRLGPHVNWIDEKHCFATILIELASFYVPEALTPSEPTSSCFQMVYEGHSADTEAGITQLRRTVEHILFPVFRTRLIATKGLTKGVIEVANLKGLYRVFERC
ncbi:MAG: DNA mismatch repair protein [Pycnora praestabilis]|nr:MAG: DNA mismatch repair protein [Pycnora praestabilis]